MSRENIISNVPVLDESILVRSNQRIHKGFKSRNKNFGNYFVRDITKTDRFEVSYLFWSSNFWNKGNEGLIKSFKEIT